MTYIDMTPTWEQILPTLLLLLRNGDAKGKQEAVRELQRMARAADLAVSRLGREVEVED
mgnify:CR=1 FL=1